MKIRLSNEERWYQKGGWIAALIIIFFPIGIVVMWRHSKWRMRTKVLITAFFALALANGSQERIDSQQGEADSIESMAPSNEQDHAAVQIEEVDQAELDHRREEELERKHLAAAVKVCERCNYSGPCYAEFIPSDNSPSFAELGGYWSCYLMSSRPKGWNQLLEGSRRGLRYDWRFVDDQTFQTVDHYNGSVYSQFVKNADGYWYGHSGTRGYRKQTRIRFINLPDRLKQGIPSDADSSVDAPVAQEQQILKLHQEGKSIREIAKELGIRRHDVKEAIKASED
jgi:hypothetical protein